MYMSLLQPEPNNLVKSSLYGTLLRTKKVNDCTLIIDIIEHEDNQYIIISLKIKELLLTCNHG